MYSMFDTAYNMGFADFARPKGAKDKQERKSRRGLYVGGGVAGAGALAAGVRYGGAALNRRKQVASQTTKYGVGDYSNIKGARKQLSQDFDTVRSAPGRAYNAVRSYDYKGAPGRALNAVTSAPGRVGSAIMASKLKTAGGLGAAGLAGYGAYRYMKNRKNKRAAAEAESKTLRGRYNSLKSRFGR